MIVARCGYLRDIQRAIPATKQNIIAGTAQARSPICAAMSAAALIVSLVGILVSFLICVLLCVGQRFSLRLEWPVWW